MRYRKLGTSDLDVSVLSMGTWQLADSDYWGDAERGTEAVRAALDAGVNLFDTAEGYNWGESEKALARALGAQRDKIHIATKVSREHCAPEKLREACEGSLRRLDTDYIDLYQVHWPSRDVPFADTCAEMLKLKQEGKIRVLGVSNFGSRDLEDWLAVGEVSSNQLGYNLLTRAIEYDILPACTGRGVGVIVYMSLMQGILAGQWARIADIPVSRRRTRHFSREREGTRHGEDGCEELALEALTQMRELADGLGQPLANVAIAWVLAQPGVTSVIAGARKPEHMVRNLGALSVELGPDVMTRLDEISQPVKEAMGANADMWEGAPASRIR